MERSADWIDQATGDLAHARNDVAGGFFDWACFSAQQAADKAVKAVISRLGGEPWGHSVADLLDDVRPRRPVDESLYDAALELDKAYIPARDPDAHPSGSPRRRYTKTEAERLVDHAARIVTFCERALSGS